MKSNGKTAGKALAPAAGSNLAAKGKVLPQPPVPPRKAKFLKIEEDPRIKLAREQYEAAVGLLGAHKFDRAMALFEKVLQAPSAELVERARVHANICRQRLEREKKTPVFKTAEDHYNYAVAQINIGKLADAEEHLQKAMKLTPRAGHLYYGLAAVQSLRGDIESALGNLRQAIEFDPANRLLARSDNDFGALYEDPRFADLIYPERD